MHQRILQLLLKNFPGRKELGEGRGGTGRGWEVRCLRGFLSAPKPSLCSILFGCFRTGTSTAGASLAAACSASLWVPPRAPHHQLYGKVRASQHSPGQGEAPGAPPSPVQDGGTRQPQGWWPARSSFPSRSRSIWPWLVLLLRGGR